MLMYPHKDTRAGTEPSRIVVYMLYIVCSHLTFTNLNYFCSIRPSMSMQYIKINWATIPFLVIQTAESATTGSNFISSSSFKGTSISQQPGKPRFTAMLVQMTLVGHPGSPLLDQISTVSMTSFFEHPLSLSSVFANHSVPPPSVFS